MGIVVRVTEGIVISERLNASLQALFQQDITFKPYSRVPNQQRNCLDRINSLHEAFLAIIRAIPIGQDTSELPNYLASCKKPLIASDLTVNEYQAILSDYTGKLIGAVHDYYLTEDEKKTDWFEKKSTRLLNKAEQYAIMQNGRNNLATLSQLSSPIGDKIIVEWDQKVIPYLPETLNELNRIKNSSLTITPQWFRQLPVWLQLYYHSSEEYDNSADDFYTNTCNLVAILTKIKPKMTWEHIEAIKALNSEDLKQLNKADTDYLRNLQKSLPPYFTSLSYHYQVVIKSLLSSFDLEFSAVDLFLKELEENGISQENIDHIKALRELPYWFLRLDKHEQRLLKSAMNQIKALEDIFSFVPSRLRTLPLLANAALHHLSILSADGDVLKQFPARMRFSHIASRDMKNEPSEIIDLYTDRNTRLIMREALVNKLVFNEPVLVQTLISPVSYLDSWIPDLFLNGERSKAVARIRQQGRAILSTNHPYNFANKIMPTAANDPSCLEIVSLVAEQLSEQAITQHFKSLVSIHSGFLSQGTYQSVCFTMDERNYKGKVFARLMQLVDACSLIKHDYSCDQFQEMVNTAWQESVGLKQANLAFSKRADTLDRKNTIVESLIQVFNDNHHLLSQWHNWLPVFTYHAFLASSEQFTNIAVETSKKYGDLAQLLCEFQHNTLNVGWLSAVGNDWYGRELWLSSLENLAVMYCGGFSSGSCVSGKDRKAIELIHTDAMLVFRECYGYWPSINDVGDDRQNFVAICSHLYTTWHQHVLSGQNACGSAGIKTPYKYLPKDIAQAICNSTHPDTLNNDDIIATNNEVGRIGDAYQQIKYNYAPYLIASMRLSEKNRIALVEQLRIIVLEGRFWASQTSGNYKFFSSALPEGIQKFKDVFEQNLSSLETLAGIYYELSLRPKEPKENESGDKLSSSFAHYAYKWLPKSLRAPSTNALYTILQTCYEDKQIETDSHFNWALNELLAFKNGIFDANKKSRSAPVSPCSSPPLPSTSSADFS